VGPDDALPW